MQRRWAGSSLLEPTKCKYLPRVLKRCLNPSMPTKILESQKKSIWGRLWIPIFFSLFATDGLKYFEWSSSFLGQNAAKLKGGFDAVADVLCTPLREPFSLSVLKLFIFGWSPEFFSGFFTQLHKLRSLRRSFLHFHFISAVHIWFISYIINTHFFHGNIWTHNWPAPNVSGFIAQLVEHRTGNREVTGSNPVEVLNFFQASLRNCINCVHCDDHFFTFKEMFDNQWRNACKVCKCPTPHGLTRWANAQRFYWKPIITLHTTAHMEFYSCKSLIWSIL